MDDQTSPANPRLAILRREVNQTVLKPFRTHGWSAKIVCETDGHDCIEIAAERGTVATRIAVLYSSGISKSEYGVLSNRVQRIFFNGQLYMPESFANGATVPVEPLGDFFPYLVDLNKQVEPERLPPAAPRRPASIRRLTAENPIEAILARLQQFTSATLAGKLVERRASTEEVVLPSETIEAKATGIAWSMRSALDYLRATPREALVKNVLGLYYGTIALAQAEMTSRGSPWSCGSSSCP